MKKNYILVILLITFFIPNIALSQVTKTLAASVLAPARCSVLEGQPTNYFGSIDVYGQAIDISTGDIYLLDIAPGAIYQIDNRGCGAWFGLQLPPTPGISSICYALTDELEAVYDWTGELESVASTDYLYVHCDQFLNAPVFRYKKDGSSTTQIADFLSTAVAGTSFDLSAGSVVVAIDGSGYLGKTIYKISPLGILSGWDTGYETYSVGVFYDGRYAVHDRTNGMLKLYSRFSGTLILSISHMPYNPGGRSSIAIDNDNYIVYLAYGAYVFAWDTVANTLTSQVFSSRQIVFFPNDGKLYAKDGGTNYRRLQYSTATIETWDGSQWYSY